MNDEPYKIGFRPGVGEVWVRGNTMFILPEIQSWMSDELKAAMNMRRNATLYGFCACGGTPASVIGKELMDAQHAAGCPATDEVILPMIQREKPRR